MASVHAPLLDYCGTIDYRPHGTPVPSAFAEAAQDSAPRTRPNQVEGMDSKDKLDLSNKNILDVLVDYRRAWLVAVVLLTLAIAVFVPRMQADPSLKAGIDPTSEAYLQHQKLIEIFGNEEFILVAIKNERGAADPAMLKALQAITTGLEGLDEISEVVSLSTLRVFQKKGELFGSYPFIQAKNGDPALPDPGRLEEMRKALPITDLLLSKDLKTLGVLAKLQDRCRFDTCSVDQITADIDRMVKEHIPPGTEDRMIGAPLIRQAIHRYNVQTGIVFGTLCLLIGTVVSVYVFRSWKVTVISNGILCICVLWVLGLMALLGIPLNSTTSLSFGFIPIVTIELVIHMVVRYHQFHRTAANKVDAIKLAVRWLARPCCICCMTTAVGFGSLMVSSIPMVRQLGFIMSIGIMISFCLSMILIPAIFSYMKSLEIAEESSVVVGWLDKLLTGVENAIFSHHRVFVAIGVAITLILFAGTPLVRSDPQVLRWLSDSTPEVKDLQFVEKNLAAFNTIELMLQAPPNTFKDPAAWKKVSELEQALHQHPEVASVDSLLPLLTYLNNLLGSGTEPGKDLFSNKALIPQLLTLTTMSSEGKRVVRRFVNDSFDAVHISVRIRNSPSVPIGETIAAIRSIADSVIGPTARVTVTGDLVVVQDQAANLIKDQIWSMFIAITIITVLMMIQLGSPLLGLLCLIPNIPPVAAVFGIMGWFGISLDSITVFAATVAIGLAVDNTIHFLTQLKREISLSPGNGIEECVRRAYRLTAKQIISWTTVTLLGFIALAVSPFRPVVFFGILGCSSLLLGLYGDLLFIQSLILWSPALRRTIKKLIGKELSRAEWAEQCVVNCPPSEVEPRVKTG